MSEHWVDATTYNFLQGKLTRRESTTLNFEVPHLQPDVDGFISADLPLRVQISQYVM